MNPFFSKLPDEILLKIFTFLDSKESDLIALSSTCKRFYNVAKENSLWIKFAHKYLLISLSTIDIDISKLSDSQKRFEISFTSWKNTTLLLKRMNYLHLKNQMEMTRTRSILEINQLECTKLSLQNRILEEKDRKLMKTHQELSAKIVEVEKQASRVASTFSDLQQKSQDARTIQLKNREIESKVLEKEHDIALLQQSKARLERQLTNKEDELRDEARQISQLKSELRNSKQKSDSLVDKADHLQKMLDLERIENQRKLRNEKQSKVDIDKEIEQLKQELENQQQKHQKEIERLNKRLNETNIVAEQSTNELSQVKSENRKFKRQILDQSRQHNIEIEHLLSLVKRHYPDLSYFNNAIQKIEK